MNLLYRELAEYYIYANHGNKVVIHDIEALTGMMSRGIMPHSVILGESGEARSMGGVISSIDPSVPIFHSPEDKTAALLTEITGKNIRPYTLSAFVEVPTPPFNEDTLLCFRRVVVINHVSYIANIMAVIDLCHYFGIDALIMFENGKSPFLPRISIMSDYRNFEIPIIIAPEDPNEYILTLKKCGYTVIATALSDETLAPRDLRRFGSERTALLFGSEPYGLFEEDISMSDYVLRIPMTEGTDSLNISQACSIALYELTFDDFQGKAYEHTK